MLYILLLGHLLQAIEQIDDHGLDGGLLSKLLDQLIGSRWLQLSWLLAIPEPEDAQFIVRSSLIPSLG